MRTILGFLAILIIIFAISVGFPLFLECTFMFIKIALLIVGITMALTAFYLLCKFIGHIILWAFRGFKNFRNP